MGDTQGEIRRPLTAATASIGAGVVHAAAVGVHAEHRSLVAIFAALAVAQVGAGVVALERASRRVLTVASLANVVSVAGWVMTRCSRPSRWWCWRPTRWRRAVSRAGP